MASVTTSVMTENYPIVTRSERETRAGENNAPWTEELVDRLIRGVEDILDVKGEIDLLDISADGERNVSTKVGPRVCRVDDRERRKRREVSVRTPANVQYAKIETPVHVGVGCAGVPRRRRPSDELLVAMIQAAAGRVEAGLEHLRLEVRQVRVE